MDDGAVFNRNKTWCRDSILQADLERIADSELVDWERLRGKRVLVTGATGLIGSLLARGLICASVKRSLAIRVTALARNPEKGKAVLGAFLEDGLELAKGDILSPVTVDGEVDFIFHCASVTASKDFVDRPVETIQTTLKGTEHLLELAREKNVQSMVYLSSMEIYGTPDMQSYEKIPADPVQTAAVMREDTYGNIDPLKVRSSYSEGKRMAEGLCAAYAHEYGVPVKTARLAQTFGAGIPNTENRVFAQFARSILNGEDIVLHTDGSKAHCYCYTTDAVLGLLTVLLRGENGQAYNISNEETYSTIRGMAEMLILNHPLSGSRLVFDIPEDAGQYGYAPTSRMLICSEKLRKLGWKAEVGLPEMFERLMGSMQVTFESG
ncbi:MAG: NAD-dependent epimerase/dehydratase family protein [Lachnospiraceae bacterium]|nr:NAD-dependent epimerase/dehydratase family protein [Lachnospiraceae bacterium]